MIILRKSENVVRRRVSIQLQTVFFVLLSLAMMVADYMQELNPVRNVLADVAYPLQYVVQLPAKMVNSLHTAFVRHESLADENIRLQQRNTLLEAQLQKLITLEAENSRLRFLLNSTVKLPEPALIAEVLSVNFDTYRHLILINRGTLSNVRSGLATLNQQGIIGQVIQSAANSSTVMLITDPTHVIPVQIDRNNLRGLARGQGDYNELLVVNIPNNEDVQIGDLLVSSGLGGRFPRGYPVATVTAVEFDATHPYARITARPTAQLDRIREVLVMNEYLPVLDTPFPALEESRSNASTAPLQEPSP